MRRRILTALLLTTLVACDDAPELRPSSTSLALAVVDAERREWSAIGEVYPSEAAPGPAWGEDQDGDGRADADDCNEQNAEIHSGSREVECDGVDQDCGGSDSCPPDRDGDGARASTDCDDDDPGVRPGAEEVPCDAIDQDCDGRDTCER